MPRRPFRMPVIRFGGHIEFARELGCADVQFFEFVRQVLPWTNLAKYVGVIPFFLAAKNPDLPLMRFLAEHGTDTISIALRWRHHLPVRLAWKSGRRG